MNEVNKILDVVLNNKITIICIWILICTILLKITDKVFKKIYAKKNKSIGLSFINCVIKALIVFCVIVKIASYSQTLQSFANTILMSSSLIVVVLGFVFQEGLSNIVHGIILTIFKPFEIGDRVNININGDIISGYIKSINLRHTVILSIIDNAEFMIANSQLDNANIKNLTTQKNNNRYPLMIDIKYQDAQDFEKLQLAKNLISQSILNHPLNIDTREDKTKPLFVKIDLLESSVRLTCFVITSNAEENVIACSEIKENLLRLFNDNNINFAYNHLEINGELNVRK